MSPRLEALGERVRCVLRGPEAIERQRLFRMARTLLAVAGWRASLGVASLGALTALARDGGLVADLPASSAALEAALDELEGNVQAVERVAIVKKRSPVAHALWLRRVVGFLELVEVALANATAGKSDEGHARAARHADEAGLLPPLVAVHGARGPLDVAAREHPEIDDARLVDLELAAIDHLMAAARAEQTMLGRRRRLFVAARQRLLEAAAALPVDREGVRARTRCLAREITRIDRLEAAGLDVGVSLVHQARQALTRREPNRLFAALSALDGGALSAGDLAVVRKTGAALVRIGEGSADDSLQRSARELLGDVPTLVGSAVEGARGRALHRLAIGSPSERETARDLLSYLPEGSEQAIVRATVAADGLFEVGGALSPVRVLEEQRVLRLVRHPTQDMQLMPAQDVHDVRDAVISDPRTVLLDLAVGRLFARRFVREETRRTSRVVMHGEVRVYVLDGSGSMQGPRARVRDAILVAELSTLIRRLEDPKDVRCTLYFRYFDEVLGPIFRVDSVASARDAIRDVVGTEREGGTDIQLALTSCLEQIALVRREEPDLARAQIVLVTDGASEVDEQSLVRAREAMGELPIGVSVIALGEENAALRGLVARQRAKGEAAFYHFLDDAELREITTGERSGDLVIHAPERWASLTADPAALAVVLDDEVSGLLDELEQLEIAREAVDLEHLEHETQARREVGLVEDAAGPEGADGSRARLEAIRRDRVALASRFERWFPKPDPAGTAQAELPKVGTPERDDVDAACAALASVAEVVTLVAATPLARQADAIELLERLLPDARLTPARYRAVLRLHPGALATSLCALRDAVAGPP